jgi:hypothetical protein
VTLRRLALLVAVAMGCSKRGGDLPASGASAGPAGSGGAVVAASPNPTCPATGEWAPCSVMYRLERAGLAPKLDSVAKPDETSLHGQSMVVKVGLSAKLEVVLYPDSAARIADAAKLDRTQLVGATAAQTIRRERTLIENANLVGLLTSINDHQRERVSDALTAGPPQPSKP